MPAMSTTSNSWSKVPAPKPSTTRSPINAHSVPTLMAVCTGWRNGMSEPVPSVMFSVTAPMAVRVVSAS